MKPKSVWMIMMVAAMGIMAWSVENTPGQLNIWRHNGPHLGTQWGYSTVAVAPANRNVLITGTYHTPSGYSGIIFKSTTGGTAWSTSNSGLTSQPVRQIKFDPVNPNIVYAITTTGQFHGFYKSINGGVSWTLKNPPNLGYPHRLAIAPSDPSLLYLIGDKLYISHDRGETWSNRPGPLNWGADKHAVHKIDPNVIFATNCEYYTEEDCNPRLYRSMDGGLNWTLVLDHPGDDDFGFIKFDPLHPDTVYTSALGYTTPSTPGLYRSDDLGATWTFQPISGSEITQLEFDPHDQNTVYAIGATFQVGKSTNRGATWTAFNIGLQSPFTPGVQEITFDPTARFLHAATSTGVYTTRLRADKTIADFDGDGRTDLSVFRPSENKWYLARSTYGAVANTWGEPGDVLVPGDYDGDGITDNAVWRPSTGAWYIVESSTGNISVTLFGISADVPIPGDFDGDGRYDLTVFRPQIGTWYTLYSTGTFSVRQMSSPGGIPVASDYDNDGTMDYAVYRTGQWLIRRSSTDSEQLINWGIAGDIPVPGDYDGDGKTDAAVFRPSEGRWYLRYSLNDVFETFNWGQDGDLPQPGDYDGDSRADMVLYRRGTWYLRQTTEGFSVRNWGARGDRPIPATIFSGH